MIPARNDDVVGQCYPGGIGRLGLYWVWVDPFGQCLETHGGEITLQTFMPYSSFTLSAEALDDLRLRNQILETSQILKALKLDGGYTRHPMTVAWRGHEEALRLYGKAILDEYRRRGGTGYMDYDAIFGEPDPAAPMPVWIGNKDYHSGQRGHLFRKDSVKYHQFLGDEDFPLLYPCANSFVERVSDGRFRPFPNPNDGRLYKTVAAAYFGATTK